MIYIARCVNDGGRGKDSAKMFADIHIYPGALFARSFLVKRISCVK